MVCNLQQVAHSRCDDDSHGVHANGIAVGNVLSPLGAARQYQFDGVLGNGQSLLLVLAEGDDFG
jgi:hypothetical protein